MKKVMLTLALHDDKDKQKAMRIVSGLAGVDSVSMDMKDRKLTVVGDIDAVIIVRKLRKLCHTDILSVGPAKEEEKKIEEPKKTENMVVYPGYYYQQQYPPMGYLRTLDEDPNGCVIS